MGRRTLVVDPRPDGRFDCRYAHWGATADPMAQSRPLGTGWSAAAVLAELDAGYERVLVRAMPPRQYCVCWLDPTLSDWNDVAVARTDDPDALRAWWTAVKSTASDRVAEGVAPAVVREWLQDRLQRRADAVYGGDDASFLFAGG